MLQLQQPLLAFESACKPRKRASFTQNPMARRQDRQWVATHCCAHSANRCRVAKAARDCRIVSGLAVGDGVQQKPPPRFSYR